MERPEQKWEEVKPWWEVTDFKIGDPLPGQTVWRVQLRCGGLVELGRDYLTGEWSWLYTWD